MEKFIIKKIIRKIKNKKIKTNIDSFLSNIKTFSFKKISRYKSKFSKLWK